MRYFISLSFKGTSFSGWQHQVNLSSVQDEVERGLSILFGRKIPVTGAGRTDAGVHAVNYTAHFDLPAPLSDEDFPKLIYKMNAILSADIAVHEIYPVQPDAHARFDASGRTYRYFIHTKKSPFPDQYSYYFPYITDIDKMNQAANYLLGEHDFTSMAKLHSNVKSNICSVKEACWTPGSPVSILSVSDCDTEKMSHPESSYCFTITSNRFLRNMVRAVVGSLLEVGRGKQEPEWIKEVLTHKNRCAAGSSVPAYPLFLVNIDYPENIF